MYTTKIACHTELKWQKQTCPCAIFTQPLYTELVKLQDCICSKLNKFGLSYFVCFTWFRQHSLQERNHIFHSCKALHTISLYSCFKITLNFFSVPMIFFMTSNTQFLQSWHKAGSDITDTSQSSKYRLMPPSDCQPGKETLDTSIAVFLLQH